MSVGGRRIRPLFKRAMMLTATLLAATAGIMAAGTSRSLSRYSTLEVEVIGDSPNNAAKEGIDWPSLRKENPDVVGWLTVEGASISYPVTSERGEHAGGWYLKHDFWGRTSTLGVPISTPVALRKLPISSSMDTPWMRQTRCSRRFRTPMNSRPFHSSEMRIGQPPSMEMQRLSLSWQSTSMPYTQTSSSSDSPATMVCAPFCAPFPKTPHAAPKTRRNLSNGLAVYSAW